MSQMLVLTQVIVNPLQAFKLKEYQARVQSDLGHMEDFKSATLWRAENRHDTYLLLAQFNTIEAADRALEIALESDVLFNFLEIINEPPEMKRLKLVAHHNMEPADVIPGQLMSMSIREADLGMGPELLEELQIIFEELSVIDGYLGSMRATSEVIEDEVYGLMFWKDRKAFEASLPRKTTHEVKVYERVL